MMRDWSDERAGCCDISCRPVSLVVTVFPSSTNNRIDRLLIRHKLWNERYNRSYNRSRKKLYSDYNRTPVFILVNLVKCTEENTTALQKYFRFTTFALISYKWKQPYAENEFGNIISGKYIAAESNRHANKSDSVQGV
jgi:hypothetical protein